MRHPEGNIVHKNKGSRALNVFMHALPSLAVGPMTAARVLYTKPLDPFTIATLSLMFAGTALPATGTFFEHKEILPSRGKQGLLALSNASMLSAVALMMMGTASTVKESDPAKIAFAGMTFFAFASMLEIPYRAARALNLMGSKLSVELTAVIYAFVGSLAFLAAQVVAYIQAKQSNNEDQANTAILLAVTSVGFKMSTGYGAVQIAKAMRSNSVVDSASSVTSEEEWNAPVSPTSRYALLPHEFPRVAPSTTAAAVVVDNDLAQPLRQSNQQP